jgi:hypothetical protein
MSSIFPGSSVNEFFDGIVADAIKARGVEASGGAQQYVVGLLVDYAKPDFSAAHTLERPLTFLLDEAMTAGAPGERFDKLRYLGDGVLYASGFFADHFEARGVDSGYLVGIGTTAYGNASSILRAGSSAHDVNQAAMAVDLYGELASKFGQFVEIVREVADATVGGAAATSGGILKLYERWQKTKSERLAKALSSAGVMPVTNARGLVS